MTYRRPTVFKTLIIFISEKLRSSELENSATMSSIDSIFVALWEYAGRCQKEQCSARSELCTKV